MTLSLPLHITRQERKGWREARAGGLKGEGDCGKEKRAKGEVMGGKFLK
jgi:hypothetical protein